MRNYKVFDLISTLAPSGVRQCRKMLKSPFFAQRTTLQRLFELIIKWQSKNSTPPDPKRLYLKLFPKQTYEALKLRGLMSDLYALIEEFLLIDYIRNDKIKSQLILSSIYNSRKLEKNFRSSLKKTNELLEAYPFRNQQFFESQRYLWDIKMAHDSAFRRTENLNLQEISENTDIHFLIRKLKSACTLLTHQSVYKTDYDFGLLHSFVDNLEESKYIKIPMVAIFYYCFRFLKEKDSLPYFRLFKKTLTDYHSQFSNQDLKGLYLSGINFCIKKLNQGSRDFAEEGLELYKKGLSQKILLENNQLTRFTFNNIVAMALFLERYTWLQEFIDANEGQLEITYREATLSFNKARLAFAQKQYGEALLNLQSAEYSDLVNNLISKLLLVQIYFELDEIDSLHSHLDSFQQFIRRREVSDYHRKNFVNIIGYVRRLINLPRYDKERRNILKSEIQAEPVLSIRGWLLQKVN